jgi:16S rRNA (cytidine1402-2'-O)-methyltransferase
MSDDPREGVLFVVATPIGNLGDLTQRAIETLRSCDRVAAEDTRRTRGLLSHLAIVGKPIDALHAHSTERDVASVAAKLEAGEKVALVTDAGTPIVSDPGDALVRAAIDRGIRVVPIPGASAVLAALVGSGLSGGGGFRFVGFLPRDGGERRDAIADVSATRETVVIFESPNRTIDTLNDLALATPSRAACIARELTKIHEEFTRGSLQELASIDREYRGEIAIVLGAHVPEDRSIAIDDAQIDARIDEELAKGTHHAKGIAEMLAAWSGRPKREIYERVVDRKNRLPRNPP